MQKIVLEKLDVVPLDVSYGRYIQSTLYHAYLNSSTFNYLFDVDTPGYQSRVRAALREAVQLHFANNRTALGALYQSRLIAATLLANVEGRQHLAQDWGWRMRMILATGFKCTRRYLDYHERVQNSMPDSQHQILGLTGVLPSYRGQGVGTAMLRQMHEMNQRQNSKGIYLDTADAQQVSFYRSLGYEVVAELDLDGRLKGVVMGRPQNAALAAA